MCCNFLKLAMLKLTSTMLKLAKIICSNWENWEQQNLAKTRHRRNHVFRCVHVSIRGSVRLSVRHAFFSMSQLWEKMVANEWENILNTPNSSSLPNFPKCQQYPLFVHEILRYIYRVGSVIAKFYCILCR